MYAHTLRRQLQPDSVIISSLERLRSQSQDQSQSDDVSCLFGCTRSSLHVSSSKRRLVVGRLIYTEAGDRIDCSKMGFSGVSIPSNLDHVGDLESDALFILLVQKGSAFCRLAENRFYNRFPCIIITAKGLPDVATRSFLRRLKIEFKLPVLALVNNDPFGLEILSVYMCGSKNDNTNLTIPDVKWLGLRPSDLYKYQFSQPCQLPMTDQEVKAVKDLLEEDFVKRNKGWLMELEMMVKTRRKAETEALCSFGLQYLTEVYLPLKLQQQDWL